jgi:uncharacterized protein YdaU (DUF1376 family)
MAKDPAFLFYPGDYLGGTMGFTLEQHGAYCLCLILQFNAGPFTEQQAKSIVGETWNIISHKFTLKNGTFFSKRLAFEIEKRISYCDSRRLNRTKSKIKHKEHMKNICETSVEHMEDENENRNKDINSSDLKEGMQGGKEKPQRNIIPPLLEWVQQYCKERGNTIDPEYFFDSYVKNGWMVGKNKMKDWQATIRTWEKNGYSKPMTIIKKEIDASKYFDQLQNGGNA